MTNEEAVARAKRAESIINSAEWVEAWSLYREMLFDQMENAKTDSEVLEARRRLLAARAARDELERMLADGAMALEDITAARKHHEMGAARTFLGSFSRY